MHILHYYCYYYYVYKPKNGVFIYTVEIRFWKHFVQLLGDFITGNEVGAKRIGRVLRAIITKPVLMYTSKNEDQLCKGVSRKTNIVMLMFEI